MEMSFHHIFRHILLLVSFISLNHTRFLLGRKWQKVKSMKTAEKYIDPKHVLKPRLGNRANISSLQGTQELKLFSS